MECSITGTVIHGKKLGRSLGFPTANLLIDPSLEIANGVYAGRVALTGKPYGALVNIGYNPTVPTGGKRLLEAHLLDFSGDLYGRTISVELVVFLRPEQKFSSVEALRSQVAEDEQRALAYFESCGQGNGEPRSYEKK